MRKLITAAAFMLLCFSGVNVTAQTPLKKRDATIKGPQTFAIVMGISKYKFVRPLTYADKDAELFRDYLKSPGGGSVKAENIFCLLNEKAISANFWGKGFQWLKAKDLQKGDRLFIYLAGHGDAIDEDQFFFLSYDCNPAGDKNNYLVAGAIQLYNLKKKIAGETTKGVEVFFIMDACRSSELPGGAEGQSFLNTAISEKRAGEIIMLATGAGQESLEDASIGNGHGLFTYYLVDGLTGSADNSAEPDNKVTYQEIQHYVDRNVPSIAQQQFKKKQDPYFCCNETTERVISTVDTAYLSRWLKLKRQQKKGPGNSYHGSIDRPYAYTLADTTLLQTYDLFNKAIENNNLTGKSSAEYYYQSMNTRFANDPYTLDAKSTLAVEFVNHAQEKINLYLACQREPSAKQKQDLYESGLRLEKAINILGEDDPDYARALRGRMYFLKSSGDFGKDGKNGDISIAFTNAYAALAIDPNGAYIQNHLAILHLENNKPDSALYYANKATKTAPKWVCALTTLALVKKAMPDNKPENTPKKPAQKPKSKFSFGGVAGGGMSKPAITPRPEIQGDTISFAGVKGRVKYDLGIIGQINIGGLIDIRPSVLVSIESSDIDYRRRLVTGGQGAIVTVPVKTTSIMVPIPVIIHFTGKNISPFISAGPVFSMTMQKSDANSDRFALKPFDVLSDLGFGVDIGLLKSHLVLSPEFKYSRGFLDGNENSSSTSFGRVISKINRQNFTFSIYVRGK
jgi:hypothetical protein